MGEIDIISFKFVYIIFIVGEDIQLQVIYETKIQVL